MLVEFIYYCWVCASPPAGDGEKLDMLINMLSKMNEKIEKLDERVKDIEMDNENENSTVAIKSEYSDKEKYEVNLTSLGFLLPEEAGKYKYDKAVEKLSENVIHILWLSTHFLET